MEHEIPESFQSGKEAAITRRLDGRDDQAMESFDENRQRMTNDGRYTQSSGGDEQPTSNGCEDYEVLCKEAGDWKTKGNDLYGKKKNEDAVEAYQSGIDCFVAARAQARTAGRLDPLEVALRLNLALAANKITQYSRAEQECSYVLAVEPENAKGSLCYVTIFLETQNCFVLAMSFCGGIGFFCVSSFFSRVPDII